MNSNHRQSDAEQAVAGLLANAAALHQTGQIADAIRLYQEVMRRDSLNFDAIYLQGMAAHQLGQSQLAEKLMRLAITVRPDSAPALNELGHILKEKGELAQSLDRYVAVLRLCPDSVATQVNVAMVLSDMGHMHEAMQYCQVGLSLKPDFVPAHVLLGRMHHQRDDLHSALDSFSRAHCLAPDDIEVLNLLAVICIEMGRPDEARPYLSKMLVLCPDSALAISEMEVVNSLVRDDASAKEALYNAGLVDQAEKLAREELSRNNSVENHNFLLKCYLVSNRHSALDYFEESRAWSKEHAFEEQLPHPCDFNNDRNPDRRLRVGIVGDYFPSVIGAFTLLPFFKVYARDQLELYCYNFGEGEEEIRPLVDQYRDIRGYSGENLFGLIRTDVIDIMLDINGRIRTPNFFETMLRQPAPIQVNWYNLPCTVGVRAYNYVITDGYCVRDGEENVYVERIFRMPTGTICAWDMGAPPVVPRPPFVRNGYITYGCFGDFFKVNEEVLATWAELLGRVSDSRLYLKSNNLRLASERERVTAFFRQRGVDSGRLILEGMSSFNQMKKCYEWVDIALDTFPYSSGSTTINALWQGVPVIAIEGPDWRGRSTAAVLAGCGLDHLIVKDVAAYIVAASELAADASQLQDLRAGLGCRMVESPQWQIGQFARNFESLMRQIWHDWLHQAQ